MMFVDYVRLRLRLRRALEKGDPELRELGRLIEPGSVAMDVGANRGVYALAMSKHARKVIAFEPFTQVANALRDAKCPNVTLHRLALSDTHGAAEIRVPYKAGGKLNHPSATLSPERPGVDGGPARHSLREVVTLSRLDDYAEPDLTFIKIDVEGFEDRVIAGAEWTLENIQPRLLVEMEERMRPGILTDLPERLASFGYRCRFLDGGCWHPLSDLGEGQRAPSGRYINNFLFEVKPFDSH